MAQNAYTALEGVSPLSFPFLSFPFFFLSFLPLFVCLFVCFFFFVLSYTLFLMGVRFKFNEHK